MKKEEINMSLSAKRTKRALSLVLCLVLLVSTVAFAISASAKDVETIADTGADTYYLWGESTNSPNFSSSSPSGTFQYSSSLGYYYCDVSGASGDYCFVVSTISNSAAYAVKTPAVQTIESGGSYYLQSGNYHGFNCIHMWNPNGDTVRIYFKSTSAGLNAVKAGSEAPTQAQTTAPTTKPTSSAATSAATTATQAPTSASGAQYVYCENEAGWSTVTAYMWNSSTDSNASWPGKAMTNIGGNIWRYQLPKTYKNIIFSQSGQSQTQDLTFPGAGYVYNNSTGKWDVYDTSPLQVSFYGTDLEAPQYEGVGITLSATAEGQGTVYYKFSVSSGSNNKVLADYSTKNYVQWIPNAAGTYTLTYEFKDAAGNTNKRTKSYSVESGLTSVSPYIKTVSPSGGEIKRNTSVSLTTNAGGGLTGTNLLFYKYTVRNSSGDIVNVPYYTLNRSYSFTPTALGAYTVTVSVQGSDNTTVEREYNFTSVNTISPTEYATTPTETQAPTQKPTVKPTETQAPTTKPTQPATQKPTVKPTEQATQAPEILRGDADDDGDVTVIDATVIQRYLLGAPMLTPFNEANADADDDGEITIVDSTVIQRYLLGLYTL